MLMLGYLAEHFLFSSISLLTVSLYLFQMLVSESRFARPSSYQTCDLLKTCLNLRVVSLVATLVFVVICGQNESDDTMSHDSYLV